MQVRIGEPVDPDSISPPELRAQVMDLREGSASTTRVLAHAA